MSGLQEGCKEILQPTAGCIIILALSMDEFQDINYHVNQIIRSYERRAS